MILPCDGRTEMERKLKFAQVDLSKNGDLRSRTSETAARFFTISEACVRVRSAIANSKNPRVARRERRTSRSFRVWPCDLGIVIVYFIYFSKLSKLV